MIRRSTIKINKELEPLENPGEVSGFASPASDYKEDRLNIIHKIVIDPVNTYYFELDNENLILDGIHQSAIIVVDRSIKIVPGKVVIVSHENEWMIRRLEIIDKKLCLLTDNINLEPLFINAETILFGVVTWSCVPINKSKNVRADRL